VVEDIAFSFPGLPDPPFPSLAGRVRRSGIFLAPGECCSEIGDTVIARSITQKSLDHHHTKMTASENTDD
jgi:hypothetical protein